VTLTVCHIVKCPVELFLPARLMTVSLVTSHYTGDIIHTAPPPDPHIDILSLPPTRFAGWL